MPSELNVGAFKSSQCLRSIKIDACKNADQGTTGFFKLSSELHSEERKEKLDMRQAAALL
jgi:hypothetical protein